MKTHMPWPNNLHQDGIMMPTTHANNHNLWSSRIFFFKDSHNKQQRNTPLENTHTHTHTEFFQNNRKSLTHSSSTTISQTLPQCMPSSVCLTSPGLTENPSPKLVVVLLSLLFFTEALMKKPSATHVPSNLPLKKTPLLLPVLRLLVKTPLLVLLVLLNCSTEEIGSVV